MMRILFVDDEPSILEGLKRLLRKERGTWEMVFACGAEEALRHCDEAPFDVIVTDMRMPGMDGAELLRIVHQRHPSTIRFVLSGHADRDSVVRVARVAHQYLSKPCDPERLKESVRYALELRSTLENPSLRDLVGSLHSLPSLPETYRALVDAMADPATELSDVAAIVERDVAMSAKVLQLVNSSFFGTARRIGEIRGAATYLGFNAIRDLVLAIEVFRPPTDCDDDTIATLASLEARAFQTAVLAKQLCRDKVQGDLAFTGGLLHDVGCILLATQLPEFFRRAVEDSVRSGRPLQVVEKEMCGQTHAEVGAFLLGAWGLPYPIVEVVAYHHRPSDLGRSAFDELTAVHVATALIEAGTAGSSHVPAKSRIDFRYLEAIGCADRLTEWLEQGATEARCGAGEGGR